jgi:hypothetical protein
METLNHYLTLAPVQTAGTIAFLAAVGLLAGSPLLAFFAEFKNDSGARADYSVLSQKISAAALIWIVVLLIFGGATVFLPWLADTSGRPELAAVATSSGLALAFYLVYHFTCGRIKLRLLHALPALAATICALAAAAWWYLPQTCSAWYEAGSRMTNSREIFSWWLGREEVARYLQFTLNAVALAAILFLLANAREKENKRRQPREYYFKAATFGEAWLICIVTLELVPLAWLYCNRTLRAGLSLGHAPEIYWLGAILLLFLLGWLLLLKVVIDGLVNRRATLIIAIFFFLSLGLFHFGPLNRTATAPRPAAENTLTTPAPTAKPAADQSPQTQPGDKTATPPAPAGNE